MRNKHAIALLVGLLYFSYSDIASAGMASATLADVERELSPSNLTRMRLEALSFFGFCLLIFTAVLQQIWNGLRRDFPILPRLSYAKALGLITLWGLLFMVVLTMISGARELMTPGAWEKKGWTSQLILDQPTDVEREVTERYRVMDRFGLALQDFARSHDGRYPAPGLEADGAIPRELWTSPRYKGESLIYRGGWPAQPGTGEIVAYELASVGPDRLVLKPNGLIVWLPIRVIEQELAENKR